MTLIGNARTTEKGKPLFLSFYVEEGGGGGTYAMITYVSKENNIGPDDKIRYIWGLKGPIFIL